VGSGDLGGMREGGLDIGGSVLERASDDTPGGVDLLRLKPARCRRVVGRVVFVVRWPGC
jgi:hypothetical protein